MTEHRPKLCDENDPAADAPVQTTGREWARESRVVAFGVKIYAHSRTQPTHHTSTEKKNVQPSLGEGARELCGRRVGAAKRAELKGPADGLLE